MGINWDEFEREARSIVSFPPFFRAEGSYGEIVGYIYRPIRVIKNKWGKQQIAVTLSVVHSNAIISHYTWTIGSKRLLLQLLDALKDIDAHNAVYKIKVVWNGTGNMRKYTITFLEINEAEFERVLNDLKENYPKLYQRLKGETQTEAEAQATTPFQENLERFLAQLKAVIEFSGAIPIDKISNEFFEKLGFTPATGWELFEYARSEDLLKIEKKKKKEYIVGVKA